MLCHDDPLDREIFAIVMEFSASDSLFMKYLGLRSLLNRSPTCDRNFL